MAHQREQIEPLRLCDAADAVVQAIAEAHESGSPTVYPPDAMGTEHQPDCLRDFTRTEVDEACRFLMRMGMLRVKKAKDEG